MFAIYKYRHASIQVTYIVVFRWCWYF